MVESDTESDPEEQPAKQIQVKGNLVSSVSKFLDQVLQANTGDDDEDASKPWVNVLRQAFGLA